MIVSSRSYILNFVIKYIMTVHAHPVLEGPFVFLPVPTPSFGDQLKLKNNVRDGRKLPGSSRLGRMLI